MRVLVTRLSSFGDIVHTWPLVQALREGSSTDELIWLVDERYAPLVRPHPAVNRTVTVATRRWLARPGSVTTVREIRAVRNELRQLAPDLVLDPQGLLKSAVWGWLTGAPRRVGLDVGWRREHLAGLFYTETLVPSPSARHVIDVNLSLARALGIVPPFGTSPDGRFLLHPSRPGPPPAAPAPVILVPATAGRGKQWPAPELIELSRRLLSHGDPVLVAWGPGEWQQAQDIVAAAGPGAALAPATDLPALAELLASAAAVVGGDTGPVHLAASLGVPTVAVHVATDPVRNAPRGPHVHVVARAATGARRGRARTRASGIASVDEVLIGLKRVRNGLSSGGEGRE